MQAHVEDMLLCVSLHVGLKRTERDRLSGSMSRRNPSAQPTRSSDVVVQQMAVGVSLFLVKSLVYKHKEYEV